MGGYLAFSVMLSIGFHVCLFLPFTYCYFRFFFVAGVGETGFMALTITVYSCCTFLLYTQIGPCYRVYSMRDIEYTRYHRSFPFLLIFMSSCFMNGLNPPFDMFFYKLLRPVRYVNPVYWTAQAAGTSMGAFYKGVDLYVDSKLAQENSFEWMIDLLGEDRSKVLLSG